MTGRNHGRNRVANYLPQDLRDALGIKGPQGEEAELEVEQEGTAFPKCVFILGGKEVAEMETADMESLPEAGDGIRLSGQLYQVVAVVYDLDDSRIEIHMSN